MSVLNQMKQAAGDAIRQAAEETRLQAKRGADAAGRAALAATDIAGEAAAAGAERAGIALKRHARETADQAVVTLKDPETKVKARKAVVHAGKSVKSALDKLNPDLLAGVVIKATSLQEQANASLRRNGSLYRISGIAIGASFPPSISFHIGRLTDIGETILERIEEPPELTTLDGAG